MQPSQLQEQMQEWILGGGGLFISFIMLVTWNCNFLQESTPNRWESVPLAQPCIRPWARWEVGIYKKKKKFQEKSTPNNNADEHVIDQVFRKKERKFTTDLEREASFKKEKIEEKRCWPRHRSTKIKF